MAEIVLKNNNGEDQVYKAAKVRFNTTSGETAIFIEGKINWEDIADPPFGDGVPVIQEVLPETPLPFSFSSGDGVYVFNSTPTQEQEALFNSDWDTAVISWDGVEYSCQPQIVQGIKAVGNVALFMGTGDTGEPFIMSVTDLDGTGVKVWVFDVATAQTDADVTHTVKISMEFVTTIPLDPKYLPDIDYETKVVNKPFGTIPAGAVVAEGTAVCDQASGDSYYGVVDEIPLVAGASYTAILTVDSGEDSLTMTFTGTVEEIDGITVLFFLSSGVQVGGLINGQIDGKTMIGITAADPVTFDYQLVAASDIVKKIDSKYLPSTMPSVTTEDNDKVMTVVNGVWEAKAPASGLPTVTTSDDGKFLRVSGGAWVVAAIPSAEGSGF